jgi:hypothetical protein
MKRHRQTGRRHVCAACGEPSAIVETVAGATVCSPCVARLRATVRSMRARERRPSSAVRAAFRNDGRRKWAPTLGG